MRVQRCGYRKYLQSRAVARIINLLYSFFWVIHLSIYVGGVNRIFSLLTPPIKMEGTGCSETSAHKIQTPGNNPKERTQLSEQGESLKSRIINISSFLFLGLFFLFLYFFLSFSVFVSYFSSFFARVTFISFTFIAVLLPSLLLFVSLQLLDLQLLSKLVL
jgi:hypothetical protein